MDGPPGLLWQPTAEIGDSRYSALHASICNILLRRIVTNLGLKVQIKVNLKQVSKITLRLPENHIKITSALGAIASYRTRTSRLQVLGDNFPGIVFRPGSPPEKVGVGEAAKLF